MGKMTYTGFVVKKRNGLTCITVLAIGALLNIYVSMIHIYIYNIHTHHICNASCVSPYFSTPKAPKAPSWSKLGPGRIKPTDLSSTTVGGHYHCSQVATTQQLCDSTSWGLWGLRWTPFRKPKKHPGLGHFLKTLTGGLGKDLFLFLKFQFSVLCEWVVQFCRKISGISDIGWSESCGMALKSSLIPFAKLSYLWEMKQPQWYSCSRVSTLLAFFHFLLKIPTFSYPSSHALPDPSSLASFSPCEWVVGPLYTLHFLFQGF